MNDRIDELAKSMSSSGVSRRGAFRRLIGGIFGLGAVAALPKRASAQTDPDPIAVCIQSNCHGLRGLDRAFCNFQCWLQTHGNQSNDYPF
jgi:hypothetical protein